MFEQAATSQSIPIDDEKIKGFQQYKTLISSIFDQQA